MAMNETTAIQHHQVIPALDDRIRQRHDWRKVSRRAQLPGERVCDEPDVLLREALQLLAVCPLARMPGDWAARYQSLLTHVQDSLCQASAEAEPLGPLLDAAHLLLDCLEDDFSEEWVESRDVLIERAMPFLEEEEAARRIEAEAATLLKLVRGEQARMEALRNALIVHLAAQEAVEQRTNELLRLTRDALALLLACPAQTSPPAFWMQRRDTLMEHLRHLLDVDTATQKGHLPCNT